MNTPYEELMRDLEALYGSSQRQPSRVIPAREVRRPRRPVSFTKCFTAFDRLSREQKKMQAQAEAGKQGGFLDRIAAGTPATDDLAKAHAILDGAVGRIPHRELCLMDLRLREMEARISHQGEPLAKSLAGRFDLRRARQQLDGLFGKIPGRQFREMDCALRQLETAANG
jgi:hypothetical protein